jgi:hypothetical protein
LGWGLLWPTWLTFRVGLATLLVASGWLVSIDDAHELLIEFGQEFRSIRSVTQGLTSTFKTFPAAVSIFELLHADRMVGGVVPCPVDATEIRLMCQPRKFPIRSNNKMISGNKAPAQSAADKPSDTDALMQTLVQSLIARESPSPSPSPPPERKSFPGKYRWGTHTNGKRYKGGVRSPSRENDADRAESDAGSATDDDPDAVESSLVLPPAAPLGDVDVRAPGAASRSKRRDTADAALRTYMATAPKKKPAGKKDKKKKAKDEEDEDAEGEEEEEGDEEDEEEEQEEEAAAPVPKAASKVTPKVAAKGKAKGKASGKAKAKSAASIAKPSILKRPAAIDAASVGKFPAINRKGDSVYWGGGRVYMASGDMVRVYPRKGDRHDKRMKFKDEKSLLAAWNKACRIIEDDDRPRIPA